MKANLSLIGRPGSGKGAYGKGLAKVRKICSLIFDNAMYRVSCQYLILLFRFWSYTHPTQTKALNVPLVVMGDVLRKHVQEGTEIGKLVADCQNEGRLADDKLVSLALLEHLKELQCQEINKTTQFGFILDGFPRTVSQAKLLLQSKKEDQNTTDDLDLMQLIQWPQDLTTSFAVNIEVPDEICIAKMKGRRKCSKCNESFNVSNVDTLESFIMPPQLPVPYPCENCDMDKDWTKRMDDTEEIFVKRMKEYHEQSAIVKQFFEDQGKLVEFIPYKGVLDMPILEKIVRDKAKSCDLQQRV